MFTIDYIRKIIRTYLVISNSVGMNHHRMQQCRNGNMFTLGCYEIHTANLLNVYHYFIFHCGCWLRTAQLGKWRLRTNVDCFSTKYLPKIKGTRWWKTHKIFSHVLTQYKSCHYIIELVKCYEHLPTSLWKGASGSYVHACFENHAYTCVHQRKCNACRFDGICSAKCFEIYFFSNFWHTSRE